MNSIKVEKLSIVTSDDTVICKRSGKFSWATNEIEEFRGRYRGYSLKRIYYERGLVLLAGTTRE